MMTLSRLKDPKSQISNGLNYEVTKHKRKYSLFLNSDNPILDPDHI